MYVRVVLNMPWPEVQLSFLQTFGKRRTKSGLCSVYYRTRKAWGMDKVLDRTSNEEDSVGPDRKIVLSRCRGLVVEKFR